MLLNFETPEIISLTEVDSTNNYIANLVREGKLCKTTIVSADYQHEGRGQRATKWQSSKAQNALFSIYTPWKHLKLEDQFVVSMLVALSIVDTLQRHVTSEVKIKWPNDIYVDSKKIAGILIESDLNGQQVSSSIIGIGLNINQTYFDAAIRATSLKLETGQNHDRAGLIQQITKNLMLRCEQLLDEPDFFNVVKQQYLNKLFGHKQYISVIVKLGNAPLTIKPLDVTRAGLLLAVDASNQLHSFDVKEIEWVI